MLFLRKTGGRRVYKDTIMEQLMGFWGLKMLALCFILTACKPVHINELTFYQYKIGCDIPFDSITLSVTNCNKYYFKDINSSEFNEFMFTKEGGNLIYKNSLCREASKIPLNIGSVVEHNCHPVFPFIGERTTILDTKIISINKKRYVIYKLYNEIGFSPSNSTTTFWEEHFGVILINIKNGLYYQMAGCNQLLLKSLKEDKDFSELWGIPSPPSPPD